MTKPLTTPPEIKEIEKKESEAMDMFMKKAKKAINSIEENHFHLRLLEAVGGKK